MSTFYQLVKKGRKQKIKKTRQTALEGCGQKKGVIVKILTTTPRKPNSAQRKIAQVRLSTDRVIRAYIPGQGFNLMKFSTVLVCGKGVPDLPGINYTLMRGSYEFHWKENFERFLRVSKYGKSKKDID